MTVQWAVLMNGFLFAFGNRTIVVNLRSLVTANLCAVSALVSMGVVLGKTSPIQLLLMALLEVSGFILNQWILLRFLEVDLTESIRQLHVFGTYFGVMFSWATYRPGLQPRHEKEKSDTKMDLFSMIGTLFLWMFWPSFNSVLIEDTAQKISAVYSTYFSLAASTVAAFGLSVLTSKKGKINMVHVHNATVAGGVAVGTAVTVIQAPWVAMTIGVIAGLTSTLGLQYIKPLMASLFQVHDTCGVQYVHGIPGILGVFANITIQLATNWTSFLLTAKEAVFQLTALSVTAALSLILGLGTGYLLKWNFWKAPHDKKCFDDQAYWKFPHLAMKL
ncbi:RHAG protein, partial [Atractosteus spatula]|nr:RHAG protein [Atractosteus spatula]